MADLAGLNRCRLCFSSQQLTDAIFPTDVGAAPVNEGLIAQIYDCTSIRISAERDFPCSICSSCVRVVGQFHSFRRKCLANEQKLRRSRGELEEDQDDKRNVGGDQKFYQQIRKEVRGYLEDEVKKLKNKAFRMAMGENSRASEFQMMDDDDEEGMVNGTDWKSKYLTLQRNNELLQQAFKEHKEKTKRQEQLLKSSSNGSTSSAHPKEELKLTTVTGFTKHSAIPTIKPSYLKALNEDCELGIKGDRQFICKLALAVFGEETLLNSSVSGKQCPRFPGLMPKQALCSQKMDAIHAKLFERVKLEIGPSSNQAELFSRTSLKIMRLTLTQKLANMQKKTRLPVASKSSAAASSEDDDEDDNDDEDNPKMSTGE